MTNKTPRKYSALSRFILALNSHDQKLLTTNFGKEISIFKVEKERGKYKRRVIDLNFFYGEKEKKTVIFCELTFPLKHDFSKATPTLFNFISILLEN